MNKYRAWVKSEKRYIVDTQDFIPLIVTNKGVMKLQPQFEKNYYEILPLDWFIIEQFTGLHDKNGVEVYENDVIELIDRLVVVKWNEYLCEFSIEFLKFKENKDSNFVFNGVKMHEINQFEVIGNIHEKESEDNDKQ